MSQSTFTVSLSSYLFRASPVHYSSYELHLRLHNDVHIPSEKQDNLSTMPKTVKTQTNANANSTASQRKKNTNQRSNVTSQHNNTHSNTSSTTQATQPQSKKSKQNQNQNQNQNQSQAQSQNQSQASTKPNSPAPPPKTATPPPAKVVKHVPLDGFNATEVDELLSSGCDSNALVYKPEQSAQKASPWGQKCEL